MLLLLFLPLGIMLRNSRLKKCKIEFCLFDFDDSQNNVENSVASSFLPLLLERISVYKSSHNIRDVVEFTYVPSDNTQEEEK